MIIYKFWTKTTDKIFIDGQSQMISCYGGSNESLKNAEEKAREKIKWIQQKVSKNHLPKVLENYEIEIREELVKRIDAQNAITRNRYGALILNCEKTVFLDIDEPKYTFFSFKRKLALKQKKEKILNQIKKQILLPQFSQYGFRVYETRKGYRVMVTNIQLSAHDALTNKLFNAFHCDKLYTKLCKKQNCFRARLTPKPSNMKFSAKKIIFPRTEKEDYEVQKWVEQYDNKSLQFATCHLVESIRSTRTNPIIEIHDQMTKALTQHSLA